MTMPKKHTLKSKLLSQLMRQMSVVLSLIAIPTMFLVFAVLHSEFERKQQEEIHTITQVIRHAMETSQNASKTIEHMIELYLLNISQDLADALKGRDIHSISQQELEALKNQYELAGLSLFVKKGEGFEIAISSEEKEVGLHTADWGYWNTAFHQLIDRQLVNVGKGYAAKNYWVGPISRAENQKEYYKYAYYYDGRTDFLINPYIVENEINQLAEASSPDRLIDQITKESGLIEDIAVVNVQALQKGSDNTIVEPDIDTPVLYGRYQPQPGDMARIQEALRSNQLIGYEYEGNKTAMKRYFYTLPESRIMIIHADLSQERTAEIKSIAFIFAASCLFLIIFILLMKAVTQKYIRPLEQISSHIGQVAAGNLTGTIAITEDNEWAVLSNQVNDMTDKMRQLILQIKKEIHSLHVTSNLLSNRIYNSMDNMSTTSLTMTDQSKVLLAEIEAYGVALQQLVQVKYGESRGERIPEEERSELEACLEALGNRLQQLVLLFTSQTGSLTNISLSFHDSLQELSGIIRDLDLHADELITRVETFELGE
ncbi:methyl-accepting chemotaxis protein [Brevibacillus migulae]|uniref:methyl-accepting chemotaxis protein n=1 Tax=Brevibacillus migulae TaxID=1644114 RepID=UPI00106E0799|nr:methyl-accepting chemotaxis protein [Brevibacillus migulae]